MKTQAKYRPLAPLDLSAWAFIGVCCTHGIITEISCVGPIHKTMFITLCLLVLYANNLCKHLDPDQAQQNVGPDLDPNCLKI